MTKAAKIISKVAACWLCAFMLISHTAVYAAPLPDDYEPSYLIPVGKSCGIKLYSGGVIVLQTRRLSYNGEMKSPAESAGIQAGDIILSVNGRRVDSSDELTEMLEDTSGTVSLQVSRNGVLSTRTLQPLRFEDGSAKLGAMVRDSTAGLGTVTFYDPQTGLVGGLGHPICDRDTGMIFPCREGELISSEISSVKKGRIGAPGELYGSFTDSTDIGSLYDNCEAGIFGFALSPDYFTDQTPLAVADEDEVREGTAEILCCINGREARRYAVEITDVRDLDDEDVRDLVIRVTDGELLSKTGGIVQGMSGSPIIQDGRLVGAVTHVLVNDPTRGYGIFIENMLDAAG